LSLPARKAERRNGPGLWPVLLVIVGVVLLLDNFLLLGDFNAVALLPLLLVVAGAQILLRGDLLTSTETRSFGITRGSVESGTIEISSGEIDVDIRALQREGRLVAGQFAVGSRPRLDVQDTYAHLIMNRADTPWLCFADWQIGLAHDLPWQFLVSTYLGQVKADLSNLITHEAVIATGFGDIHLVCPPEAFSTLYLRSTLGNIHVATPPGYNARIIVDAGRLFKVHADVYRYENPDPNTYLSTEVDEGAPPVTIHISGTFGDAYLI
jgi:hypothetical protein